MARHKVDHVAMWGRAFNNTWQSEPRYYMKAVLRYTILHRLNEKNVVTL